MFYLLHSDSEPPERLGSIEIQRRITAGTVTPESQLSPETRPDDVHPAAHYFRPQFTALQQLRPPPSTDRAVNIARLKAQSAAAQAAQSITPVVAQRPPQARPALQEIRRQNLNFTGWGLVVFGALLAAYFFFIYDTSVRTERQYITGYGSVGGERVHNQGLMQNRLLGGITGLVVTGIGAALIIANPSRTLK